MNYIEEELTPFEKLEEYISDTYEMEFMEDEYGGATKTVEQDVHNCYEALKEKELKNMYKDIEEYMDKLKKYKDKGLFTKFCVNENSCIWGTASIVFGEKYEFVDIIYM